MDLNDTITKKPCRVSEMQVGETIFTVISVESDLAKENLYNKVKRMILDSGSNKINTSPIHT